MKQPTSHETCTTDSRNRPSDHDRMRPEDEGPTTSPGRRTFLRAVGGLAVAGVLAGCTDGNGGTANGNGGTGNGGGGDSVDEWLSDTDNYDSVTDLTDEDAVTVEVGPGSDEMTFEPAAIRVTLGTTVTWEWIDDGYHNVVDRDDAFDSGGPEEGATFEHSFDAAGTSLYYCDPHKSAGMKGAVVVEGEDGDGTALTQG
ncbi:halocyanin domain-containing protein [Halorarum halophilum]|nr:halocyanin domain-containing protein [Halobaculum halophilum]